MADLDLSLFHDVSPKISVNDLHANLPERDILWQAKSADEWLEASDQMLSTDSTHGTKLPPSLYTAFRKLVNREIFGQEQDCTPAHLRLLLQPLQALASHLYHYLGGIFHGARTAHILTSTTNLASEAQLDEVRTILQQWYTLCTRSMQRNSKGMCPATCQNLITYHLMNLNNLVCFPELERLAHCEMPLDQAFQRSSCLRVRCVEGIAQVLFHCGQALRLITALAPDDRPVWWAAALYRVALILWKIISANSGTNTAYASNLNPVASSGVVVLDRTALEDESVQRFLRHLEGVPVLTKLDGTVLSLDQAGDVLDHIVCLLDRDTAFDSRYGFKNMLCRLRDRS